MKRFIFLLLLLTALHSNAAALYVRSTDGSDADNGTTWALAKATLAGAFAIAAAGDRIWVSQVHAETQAAAMTLTSPGTAASPCEVLCGNDAAEPPTALATTATVTVSGNALLSFAGFAYCYGCTFFSASAGSASAINWTSASPWWWKLETCSLRLTAANANSRIACGLVSTASDDSLMEWVNVTLSFANAGQGINVRAPLEWSATSGAILGTIPTTLFLTPASGNSGSTKCIGVDLSALGSGKNLVDVAPANFNHYDFLDCKLGASVAITVGSVVGQGGAEVTVINCDSSDTNYRYYRQTDQGTITHETTIIRTGGASDGTTGFSRKIVTTANSKFFSPLESRPVEFWNESLSSQTMTFYLAGTNQMTDAQAWIEVESLNTSGFPLGGITSDSAANIIATPANQDSDTSAWDTGSALAARANLTIYTAGDVVKVASNTGRIFICISSGTTGVSEPAGFATAVDGDDITDATAVFRAAWRQKTAVTFAAAEKGIIRGRLMVAKPSATLYWDPKLISGARQYMTESGVQNEPASGGATGGSYTFGQ